MSCPQNARSDVEHDQRSTALISQESSRIQPQVGGHINNMLQFRNDSGFLSNRSGQARGVCVIHNPGHPKSQRLRARTTDQCEIRCERQGRRSGASAEPFGQSTRVPTGTRAIRDLHCTESDLAQHHWSSTVICPTTVSVQISRAASVSSSDCATSPRAAVRPKTPHRDNIRKEDSRCAGITK
jgi:hypothetical protein